jgi:hypothetical protein
MLGLADGEETMPTVEMYDPATDTWTTKSEMNIPRKYISGCAFNRSGKIYVFGGTPGFLAPSLSSIEAYEPETDTWTVVSEMPIRLCAHSVTFDDGKAYISGGITAAQPSLVYTNEFFEYDPSKDLMPYIKKIVLDKSYAEPGMDSILITAAFRDTEGLSFNAVLVSPEGNILDSLPLFDDGNHGDGSPGDSVYANIWPVDPVDELHYYAGLHLTQQGTDTVAHHLDTLTRFTTIGPLSVDGYTLTPSDTTPNPGDRVKVYLHLHNEGILSSAEHITARLRSLDTLAETVTDFTIYQEIPPGETGKSSITNTIDISDDCPVGRELAFELEISSKDYLFWIDTFNIVVEAPVIDSTDGINDLAGSVCRIYPNPATDQLTLEFDEILNENTSIKLLDITGKLVYSETLNNTGSLSHTINLSSLRKGLYLIRISNDEYSVTEKVIKIN